MITFNLKSSVMSLYIRTVIVCLSIICKMNSQNYGWAKRFYGSGSTSASGITLDGSGNVYSIGGFGQDLNFGSNSLNTGFSYLVKHDANGNYLWSRNITEPGSPYANPSCVATSTNGNVFVAGSFGSSSITIGNYTLVNNGPDYCCFIACYNSSGSVMWAKCSDGNGFQHPYGIATDKNNDVYITGIYICPTISFGSLMLNSECNGDYKNSFVVKYSSIGNEIWAKNIGGADQDIATAICTDKEGSVYVTGGCSSPTVVIGNNTLTPTYFDVFLVKYSSTGNVVWLKDFGGNGSELGRALAVDEKKNIYLAGTFNPTLVIGTTTLLNFNCYGSCSFITKLDSLGSPIWAKGAGGPSPNNIISLSSYSCGVYASGLFISTMAIGNHSVNSIAGKDGDFIINFDSIGNVKCSNAIYSMAWGNYVCTDRNGTEVYTTGGYKNNPLSLGSITLPNTGSENLYLGKFSCSLIQNVAEFKRTELLQVYPNPSVGEIIIASESQNDFTIYNEMSQVIKAVSLNYDNNYKTKLDGLSPGVYFIKGKSAFSKVIVLKE